MPNPINTSVVELSLKEGINVENLHQALARIFEANGCQECGLVGIDLRLRVQPEDVPQLRDSLATRLQDLPDVLDVNILRGTDTPLDANIARGTGGMADG